MASLMPHGFCLASDPWLIFGLVVANLCIALVYLLIPLALLKIHRAVGFMVPVKTRLGALFVAFIALCGSTHLMLVLTMFVGGSMYVAELATCVAAAVVSAAAMFVTFRSIDTIAMHLRSVGHALQDIERE